MKNLFCLYPFYYMDLIGTSGEVSCCCMGWVKDTCGSLKTHSLPEIWNGARYQQMRARMLAGQWEDVCNPVCPMVTRYQALKQTVDHQTLQHLGYITPLLESEILAGKTVLQSTPSTVILSNSGLCNHECIMCGWKDAVDNRKLLKKAHRGLLQFLPNMRELILTGAGEPFVRHDTRAILLGPAFENLQIRLITNGVLLPRFWDRIKHHNFSFINVSVDAATKATYETIHRRSKWEDLIAALDFLRPLKHRFIKVIISMTVMKENYREIPAFLELARNYAFRAQLARVREGGDLKPSSNFFDHDQETVKDFVNVLRALPPGATEDCDLTNLIAYTHTAE